MMRATSRPLHVGWKQRYFGLREDGVPYRQRQRNDAQGHMRSWPHAVMALRLWPFRPVEQLMYPGRRAAHLGCAESLLLAAIMPFGGRSL
jgi:hypothetical protein